MIAGRHLVYIELYLSVSICRSAFVDCIIHVISSNASNGFPKRNSMPDRIIKRGTRGTATEHAKQSSMPSRRMTYEWRPLLSHEEFCYDEDVDHEEGPRGYLVDFYFPYVEEAEGNRRKKMFMRHRDTEHGTWPIQEHYHKDMLKALRDQMNLSPDFVFPSDYVSYGYIESCKRQERVGG